MEEMRVLTNAVPENEALSAVTNKPLIGGEMRTKAER